MIVRAAVVLASYREKVSRTVDESMPVVRPKWSARPWAPKVRESALELVKSCKAVFVTGLNGSRRLTATE